MIRSQPRRRGGVEKNSESSKPFVSAVVKQIIDLGSTLSLRLRVSAVKIL